jgi:hypothetical protein
LIDIQAKDRQSIEGIYKRKLLEKKHVLTYADFTGTKEADVEDMFDRDFYLEIVNAEYDKQLQRPLTLANLNQHLPRITSAIEDALEKMPLKSGEFGHYRPARYFSENLDSLKDKISARTKERFATAFAQLNLLLK